MMRNPQAGVTLRRSFFKCEDGSVTVEFVVLTAISAVLAMATLTPISSAAQSVANTINIELGSQNDGTSSTESSGTESGGTESNGTSSTESNGNGSSANGNGKGNGNNGKPK
jgi:hypothetical protein